MKAQNHENDCSSLEQIFGKRLRAARGNLSDQGNMTQAAVAKFLEVSVASYGKWERGESLPSTEKLLRIATRFEVSVDYLLGRTDVRDVLKRASGDRCIPWDLGVTPLSEEAKTAVGLFGRIASGKVHDWSVLLNELASVDDKFEAVRLLERAVEAGWVIIQDLRPYSELEDELKKSFSGLKRTRVIDLPHELNPFPEFKKLLVAQAAADFFSEIARSGDSVAFSGGGTILLLARCVKPCENLKRLRLYPLDIHPHPSQVAVNSSSVVAYAKVRLNAEGFVWHHGIEKVRETPFDPLELSLDAHLIFRETQRCRIAFVGIGNPKDEDSSAYDTISWFLAPRDVEKKGAVADVLHHLIEENGEQVDLKFNTLIPSLSLSDLRRMARTGFVIGVATGNKAEAVRATLRGRYLSALVLDKTLAQEVLEG